MKKEYLILAVIIAGICAYLFTHNRNRTYYELPEVPALNQEEISVIQLEKEGKKAVRLLKKDNGWVVTENAYPADQDKVNEILKSMTDIRLTALISETRNRRRYGLDSVEGISVTLENGKGKVLQQIFIGKTAPSYHHTFVSLEKEGAVFHAAGDFRRTVDKTVQDLRDKTVLTLAPDAVTRIALDKDGVSDTLTQHSDNSDTTREANGTGEATPSAQSDDASKERQWRLASGRNADPEAVSTLVQVLSNLSCERFMEEGQPLPDRTIRRLRVEIQTEKDQFIELFDPNEDGRYPARTSDTVYAFELDGYTAERVLEQVNTLLGIETPEEEPEKDPA